MYKWIPFPENQPSKFGWYLVTVTDDLGTRVKYDQWTREDCGGNKEWRYSYWEHIRAFAELPEPYNPEGKND